jgi:hypothetical protein
MCGCGSIGGAAAPAQTAVLGAGGTATASTPGNTTPRWGTPELAQLTISNDPVALVGARISRHLLAADTPAEVKGRLAAIQPEYDRLIAKHAQQGGHSLTDAIRMDALEMRAVSNPASPNHQERMRILETILATDPARTDASTYALLRIDLERARSAGTPERARYDALAAEAVANANGARNPATALRLVSETKLVDLSVRPDPGADIAQAQQVIALFRAAEAAPTDAGLQQMVAQHAAEIQFQTFRPAAS